MGRRSASFSSGRAISSNGFRMNAGDPPVEQTQSELLADRLDE
jgi:hypothetical protein